MAELLLEILSEEIPARMQERAADDLQRMVADGLAKAGLAFEAARTYVTPRRLVLVIAGLPEATPDIEEERRGPRVGAPEAALDGFLKSAGVSRAACVERDTGKGVFYFALVRKAGRRTADLAREVIEATMADFPWPKSMRWGTNHVRWVRPIQSILCLFAGHVVPVAFGPVLAGTSTRGHRFLAPDPFDVADFADYAAKIGQSRVVLDPAERRHAILSGAEKLAAQAGYTLKADDGLLAEVTGLVEWPVMLMGRIDDTFMDVPKEVLITSMKSHQKYFSCLTANGDLAPRFILASNMVAVDGGAAIVAGNERVLRARLSDAKFFWDTDRRHSLETRLPKLAERLFYAKLGAVADKVARMQGLAGYLAPFVGAEAVKAVRAARLSKADLATEMVGEFPELQGIMGRYYALHDGEPADIAEAIGEHYAPQGPNDRCPGAPLAIAVSLADKIDTLVGFFAIDEKPTGSKDPFALRRAALGIIRLLLENGVRLDLGPALRKAYALFDLSLPRGADEVTSDLLEFFADRLKVHLREQGVRHDLVSAVFALGDEDDLVRLLARVHALAEFLKAEDGANLLVAYRRAVNIVRIEEKKDQETYDGPVDALLLSAPEERALAELLQSVAGRMVPHLESERFVEAMSVLASLRPVVDAFFDKVTVNAEDRALRANRLRLLSHIGLTMGKVADFAKIEG
jgi:glycyl-tRNA synthetase beta chain